MFSARSSHSLIRSRTTGIDQKLKSVDVIDMLSDLFLLRGVDRSFFNSLNACSTSTNCR